MDIEPISVSKSAPVLVLKIANHPLAHGILGIVRSLGRWGVDVYASCEDRGVPYAFSKFLKGRIRLPPCDRETQTLVLVAELVRMVDVLGTKCVLLPTDDESAIVVAEHAAALSQYYIVPQIEPSLPRRVASKRRLYELGKKYDVAMPATTFAETIPEVLAFADGA